MPFGVDKQFSVVDLLDLAETTAIVATDPGHLWASYELAGPEPLSQNEMAAILGDVLGREVTARQVPLDEMEAARTLYETLGFEEVAPYYFNPLPGAHYLKAELDDNPSRY